MIILIVFLAINTALMIAANMSDNRKAKKKTSPPYLEYAESPEWNKQ